MPFEDAREFAGEQADVIEDDRPLPEEVGSPTIYPSNPDYFIRVYYEASRFPNEQALQELYERKLLEYAPRRLGLVELDPKSLEYRSLSPFPKMEKRFLDVGFVADVEGRMFGSGPTDTKFVERNKIALNGNAMAMKTLWLAGGHRLLPPANEGELLEETVERAMAPILGKETVRNGQIEPDPAALYPLAEHHGLLLGCTDFTTPRRLHWATETTPAQVIEKGGRKEIPSALFDLKTQLVLDQLLFEFQHAPQLLREVFLEPTLEGPGITDAMVLTWYSQVIAAIRKICWLVSAQQNAGVIRQSLHEERAMHGRVIGAPRNLGPAMRWDALVADRVFTRNDEIAQHAAQWGPILGPIDMTYEISWKNEILAALMGATYRADTDSVESPFQNRDIFVRCLAYWIGSLKRKRRATIDWYTAEGILEICRRDRQSNILLLSQFPSATWARLEEISEWITNAEAGTDIEVSYTWTRDLVAPYKYEQRDDIIALEGPLLCFPVLAAAEWREKAGTIATLRGFEVRGPRRR